MMMIICKLTTLASERAIARTRARARVDRRHPERPSSARARKLGCASFGAQLLIFGDTRGPTSGSKRASERRSRRTRVLWSASSEQTQIERSFCCSQFSTQSPRPLATPTIIVCRLAKLRRFDKHQRARDNERSPRETIVRPHAPSRIVVAATATTAAATTTTTTTMTTTTTTIAAAASVIIAERAAAAAAAARCEERKFAAAHMSAKCAKIQRARCQGWRARASEAASERAIVDLVNLETIFIDGDTREETRR